MIRFLQEAFKFYGAPAKEPQFLKIPLLFCASFGFTTIGNLVNFSDEDPLRVSKKLKLTSCFNFSEFDKTTTIVFLNERGKMLARQFMPHIANFDKNIIRNISNKEKFFHDLVVQNIVFEEIKLGRLNITKIFGESVFFEKFGEQYFSRKPDAIVFAPRRKIAIEFENTTKSGATLKVVLTNCIFDIATKRIQGSRWYFLKNESAKNYLKKLLEIEIELCGKSAIFDPKTGEKLTAKQIKAAARKIQFPAMTNRIIRGI